MEAPFLYPQHQSYFCFNWSLQPVLATSKMSPWKCRIYGAICGVRVPSISPCFSLPYLVKKAPTHKTNTQKKKNVQGSQPRTYQTEENYFKD